MQFDDNIKIHRNASGSSCYYIAAMYPVNYVLAALEQPICFTVKTEPPASRIEEWPFTVEFAMQVSPTFRGPDRQGDSAEVFDRLWHGAVPESAQA